ncbi:S8 family serine peptidase, partial [Candidatus Calescamantes bacterium]|nr:S8 family serine peptidase [Candidatus Calescamantes bacterium]
MKKLFLIFLVSLFTISLNANEIGGDLQDMLIKAGDEDYISVVVHLKDQVDARMLSEDLRGVGNTRSEIHKQVIDTLTDRAASTQVELKDVLARHQLKSDVERYTSFWIFNGFTVTAKKAVIYEIAARDDVELVRAELKFFIPENEFANQPVRGVRAEVKDYGVKLINADDMWAEGYDGTGLIIANMDTGVNYYHKDLKDKWLGNSKPNSQCWFDPWEGSTIPKDGGVDTWQHGSHTMGSIVGEDVSGGIKYGVAPGAKWIAVRMFNTSGSASEENTIKCFQWLADPDGNSSTSDDVPDILNNSWGA